jgi:hypothetical protein
MFLSGGVKALLLYRFVAMKMNQEGHTKHGGKEKEIFFPCILQDVPRKTGLTHSLSTNLRI